MFRYIAFEFFETFLERNWIILVTLSCGFNYAPPPIPANKPKLLNKSSSSLLLPTKLHSIKFCKTGSGWRINISTKNLSDFLDQVTFQWSPGNFYTKPIDKIHVVIKQNVGRLGIFVFIQYTTKIKLKSYPQYTCPLEPLAVVRYYFSNRL